MNGTIKSLVRDKGFGFLSGEDGREYFFHRSALIPTSPGSVMRRVFDDLQDGDRVRFVGDVADPKGPRASLVEVLTDRGRELEPA